MDLKAPFDSAFIEIREDGTGLAVIYPLMGMIDVAAEMCEGCKARKNGADESGRCTGVRDLYAVFEIDDPSLTAEIEQEAQCLSMY